MDGYAVRLADVAAPRPDWRSGTKLVAAGDAAGAPLGPGEAVRVMTGAPLPDGTEAVVPGRGRSPAGRAPSSRACRTAPGEHVRRRGESVAAGTALLVAAGRRLGGRRRRAGRARGSRSAARPRARASRSPSPATSSCRRRRSPGPGSCATPTVRCSRRSAAARGWAAALRPAVADEDAAVRRLFRGPARDEDILITSGGVSAGDLDLLPAAAERRASRSSFTASPCGPASRSPSAAEGRRSGSACPETPSRPPSASTLFVRLALDLLEGADPAGAESSYRAADREPRRPGPRETYRDASLEVADGENRVAPLETRGSHDLGGARAGQRPDPRAGGRRAPGGRQPRRLPACCETRVSPVAQAARPRTRSAIAGRPPPTACRSPTRCGAAPRAS